MSLPSPSNVSEAPTPACSKQHKAQAVPALRGLPGKTVFGTENTPETAEQASEQENGNTLRQL